MLTDEQMLVIGRGYLVTHSDFFGIWVVMDREYDTIRVQEVNCCVSSLLSLSVDDKNLNIYHIYQ